MSIVRADGDNNVLALEENEVVIFRSFFKAGLRFPLSRFVVEVLKTYQIFLHQMTPEAILRMGVFMWAVRSQGIEPSAKCFCSMHELLYETKAMGKEQYHNNFGCYGFIARPNASHPVPTFRKRWPGDWMTEWFYVKNDLSVREDIKGIIMRPIWQSFGLRRPKVEMNEAAEECQRAFGVMSAAFGGRKKKRLNRVFDAIGFVYPDYCYPVRRQKRKNTTSAKEEAATAPSEPEPERKKIKVLTHRPRYIEPASVPEFTEKPSSATEAKKPTSAAFGGRKKKRLNRVFDAIGFVYPDYCYPVRRQKRKNTTSAKEEAATAPSEPEPERKKIKVLTHRPRYIEPASVPEFTEKPSSATEAKKPTRPVTPPAAAGITETAKKIELEEPKVSLPETKEMAEALSTEKWKK